MQFILSESFRTIRKAKLYFLLSVLTTAIGVFLIQASYLSGLLVQHAQKEISNNLTVQLYVKDLVPGTSYEQTEQKLKQFPFIKSWQFVSKSQAEDVFLKETGEDFRKILDYNPLPASYTVQLTETLIDPAALDGALNQLRAVPMVTEVGFAVDLYKDFVTLSLTAKKYLYTITIILVAIAFYIGTSFSIALLDIRAEEIRTMRFVGSSRLMIAAPVLINSVVVGFIGALIAVLGWWAALSVAGNFVRMFFGNSSELWTAISLSAISGVIIGGISGFIALTRLKTQK